jgi:hypothetical protein
MNPKDIVGKTKPPIGLIPGSALVECSLVAKHGNDKYGPFNWRDEPIEAMEYAHAILRHVFSWIDGETIDPESGRHHLAHVMLTCGIVIDAGFCGTLKDNRPTKGHAGAAIRTATAVAPDAPDDSRAVVDGGAGEAGEPGGAVVGRHRLGQPHDSDR